MTYNEKSLFGEELRKHDESGNELRDRHFNHLIHELSGMMADTVVSLGRLQ